RHLSPDFCHWQATASLQSWLDASGIPIMTGCDTRRLVRHLRGTGAQRAVIASLSKPYPPEEVTQAPEIVDLVGRARTVHRLEDQDLVREVSEAFVDTGEVLSGALRPRDLKQWPG